MGNVLNLLPLNDDAKVIADKLEMIKSTFPMPLIL